ncbi:YihY/virulence factor BrkB family protein [Subtercola vilae]|uniref:YihY/virulence factor BrkB family protein n=1 Tax=Subtercola vilae TaxID=2056433 RepID=A0A4V4RHD1_9MICO|nr:YihY/virulence factor BrkB family protein [Subtercola vilae]TIH39944.1 YihY/virulence factor BrkB family protein [Subtercola vilae]
MSELGGMAGERGVSGLSLRERRASSALRALDRRAILYAMRRATHGFFLHRGIDAGATLTFFSALAFFPATLAVVSTVGLLDPQGDAVRVILNVIDTFVPKSTVGTTRLALEQFTRMPDPFFTLVVGLALTVWTGASYATAFGRIVNGVYGVEEGRRFIKLRLLMLLEAVVLIVLLFTIAVIVIITPDVAKTIVTTLGWPPVASLVWSVLKWPALALLAVFTVVVLHYGTPNLRRPRIRLLSVGATFSIVAWSLTTAGYSFYVSTFAAYDKFYGLLGGAIITLIWLFLSNLVLVIGVEVDAELTRARQLLREMPAEESIQVPLRDNHRNLILARRLERDTSEGVAIRGEARRLRRQRPPAN